MTDFDYRYFDTIDSTNNEAKRIVAAQRNSAPLFQGGEDGRPVLLAARSQTAGRGRQGKSFFSPADTGLYMTVAIPVRCPITSQVTMTTRVAVAVSKAIEEFFDKDNITPAIKWVNDIYVNGRKCCGILCEAVNDYEKGILEWVIIGVGINITTIEWPEELENIAGSLGIDTFDDMPSGDSPGRFALSVAEQIMREIEDTTNIDYLDYYRKHSNVLGREISFTENGVVRYGTAIDVNEQGGLIVKTIDESKNEETVELSSGEITVRVKTSV